MPRNYKQTPGSRTYHNYMDETLQKCLSQLKDNKILMKAASQKYSIPYRAIRNKINGWHSKQYGGQKQLSGSFENTLVGTIDELTEWKVPLSGFDIRCLVKTYLDKMDYIDPRFNNNLPGKSQIWNFSDFKILNKNLIFTPQTDFIFIIM